jgi:serine/threonine protein kinase
MAEDDPYNVDKIEDSTRITKGSVSSAASDTNSQSLEQRLVTTGTAERVAAGSDNSDSHSMRQADLPSFGSVYETLGILGAGGMSIVYKVRHKVINKLLAAKMLQMHLARDDNQIKRFKAEAKALFSLAHPNIVSVREFDLSEDQKPYLLMDYLEGKALNEELKIVKVIPVPRALKLFVQACDGLDHAHGKGIIHRDIKPSNIILTKDENGDEVVKLVDFGIAKLTQDGTGETLPALTATGDVFGSPPYMSPEQCSGSSLDTRSDVYSLGCVMYEVLSGAPPFQADSAMAVIHKHTNQLAEPLKVPNCDLRLSQRLDEIIFKALEKNPGKRYQSMAELKNDLLELSEATGFRKSTGVYLKYTRSQRKFSQQVKQHPILSICTGTFVVASLAAFFLFGVFFWKPVVMPLQVEPSVTLPKFSWAFESPVKEKDTYYEERRNLADVIVTRAEMQGTTSDDAITRRHKLAEFYMRYGDWDRALDLLEQNFKNMLDRIKKKDSLDENDIRLAVNFMSRGDCHAAMDQDEQARDCYREAARIFAQHTNDVMENESLSLIRLKLARLCFRHGDYVHAQQFFEAADTNPSGLDSVMRSAGLGDCNFIEGMSSPTDRNNLIRQARDRYVSTLAPGTASWIHQNDTKNSCIAVLRIIDTYIAEHDYAKALSTYDEPVYHRILRRGALDFPMLQQDLICTTHARLLWRNGKYFEAIDAYLHKTP